MTLNERETATVLFALRFLQNNLEDLLGDTEPNEMVSSYFTSNNGEPVEEPSEEFIDELCIKINIPYAD